MDITRALAKRGPWSVRRWIAASLFLFAAGTTLQATTIFNRPTSPIPPGESAQEPAATPASDGEAAAEQEANADVAMDEDVTQGALRIVGEDGGVVECPLEHTDVDASISGFIARVNVTQTFTNSSTEPIEAVYVFPLPNQAAVDQMTMVIGDKRIVGQIKRRDQARRIYEQAIASGQTASLLEQERPNIFTQSVGNIEPGQEVQIEISYVDVLKYDMGVYEFHFPMVVGPRYMPSGGIDGPADGDRINAPVLTPDQRTGHDISLNVSLDAGVPVQDIKTPSHETFVGHAEAQKASVALSPADTLPNKDFVMRYKVVGEKPAMAVLAHTDTGMHDASRLGDGYFLLMIQPGEDQAEALAQTPPREFVFLVDTSGSMRGAKTEQVKECMRNMLTQCRPEDRFQIVRFAGSAEKLFEAPVPVTEDSLNTAMEYNNASASGGGTEMLRGIQMAMDAPIEDDRMRIVVLLSDGFIGNEDQIIQHVGENCGDQIRFWAVGVDSSPNMHLIDGVARQGGGMGKRLAPNEPAEPITTEIMSRLQRAQLAHVNVDFGDFEVCETYPAKIPELWAGRPIIMYGRYRNGGEGELTVNGKVEGEPVSWNLTVELAEAEPDHDVIAKTWARQKIEELMHQSFYAGSPAVEEEVTAIALNYGLMSQYTSFVAVDSSQMPTTDRALPRRVMVPIPLPAFNEWEGYFGGPGEGSEIVFESRDFDARLGGALFKRESEAAVGLRRTRSRGRQGQQWATEALARRSLDAFAVPTSGAQAVRFGVTHRGLSIANGAIGGGGGGGFGGGGGGGFGNSPNFATSGYGLAQQSRGRYRRGIPAPARGGRAYSVSGPASPSGGLSLEIMDDGAVASDEAAMEKIAMQIRVEFELADLVGGEGEGIETISAWMRAANQALEEGDLEKAEQLCALTYYVSGLAYANSPETQALFEQSQTLAQKLEEERMLVINEAYPALTEQLDIVLRDVTIREAVAQIVAAAGVECQLEPAVAAEAAERLNESTLQIDYLDLRNVTAIEALSWLASETGLLLIKTDSGLEMTTRSRLEGFSAAYYPVNEFLRPTGDEVDSSTEEQVQELIGGIPQQFTQNLFAHANVGESCRHSWYHDGVLIVIGEQQDHANLRTLLTQLRQADVLEDESTEAWRLELASRVTKYATRVEKIREQQSLANAEFVLAIDGVQLLTQAAGGQLDLEALTHLQIAWQSIVDQQAANEAYKPNNLHVAAWLITESARVLSKHSDDAAIAELEQLAGDMSSRVGQSVDTLFAEFAEDRANTEMLYQVVFTALTLREDSAIRQQAMTLLSEAESDGAQSLAVVVGGLLGESSDNYQETLETMVKTVPSNAFSAILLAIACHDAGQETWLAYRTGSENFSQILTPSGELAVLANRLPLGLLELN